MVGVPSTKGVKSNFLLEQKPNYIHQSSLEGGFVREPEDSYSNTGDYAGIKGLVIVTLLKQKQP